MRPIDPPTLHRLEEKARDIGRTIGGVIEDAGTKYGFCLLLFSFEGPEMTWISNANRADMITALEEFIAKAKAGTADGLSRPKGRG